MMYQCSQYKHPLILHFQSLMSEQSEVMGMWLGSWIEIEKRQHKLISIYFSGSQIYQKKLSGLFYVKLLHGQT